MKASAVATIAQPSQLEAMRPFVQGVHCVIVGSAPLPTRYVAFNPRHIYIAVNGGISSVDPTALPIWVVGSKAQDQSGATMRHLHRLMLEQARQRIVEHALLLRGPKIASEAWTLKALESMRCFVKSWSVLDKTTKRWIEGEICARKADKQPCSSGILAAAVALWAGAESVRLEGFSFQAGYHYLPHERPQNWWRDHVEADKRALVALSALYGSRLSGDVLAKIAA